MCSSREWWEMLFCYTSLSPRKNVEWVFSCKKIHAKLYSKYWKLQIMFNQFLIDTPLAQSLSFSADNYDIVVALSERSSHKYTIILTWLEGSISALDVLTSGFRTSHSWLFKFLRPFIWDERRSRSPASVSWSQTALFVENPTWRALVVRFPPPSIPASVVVPHRGFDTCCH